MHGLVLSVTAILDHRDKAIQHTHTCKDTKTDKHSGAYTGLRKRDHSALTMTLM